MRIFFKIFWKISLGISATIGLLLLLILTVLGYLSKTIDWEPIIQTLKENENLKAFVEEAQFIRDFAIPIATIGTIYFGVLIVCGIAYAILNSIRKRKNKK